MRRADSEPAGNGGGESYPGAASARPSQERFIIARAAGQEFAVPAGAVAAVDIATEDRWADLGGGARGVLWEGRYLFVESMPAGSPFPPPGRGEMPILVIRGERGLKALIIERLLGEAVGPRHASEPPWAGRVECEGHSYPVLAVAVPEIEAPRVAEPAPEAVEEPEPLPEPPPEPQPEPVLMQEPEPQPEPEPPPAPEPVEMLEPLREPEPVEMLEPLREPEPVPRAETPKTPVQIRRREAELPEMEPASAAGTRAAGDGRMARSQRWRYRAVIVDPRVAWRRGLARRLRERGFEVREATRPAEFRGAAGIAFVGDLQMGLSPEIVAEMLAAWGWRPVLVSTKRMQVLGPFEAILVWPVRDEELDGLLASMGGGEDVGGTSGRHPGGGTGTT